MLLVSWVFFLTAPRGMWDPSSLTKDQTHSPWTGRWNLNHSTTREVLIDVSLQSSLGISRTSFALPKFRLKKRNMEMVSTSSNSCNSPSNSSPHSFSHHTKLMTLKKKQLGASMVAQMVKRNSFIVLFILCN